MRAIENRKRNDRTRERGALRGEFLSHTSQQCLTRPEQPRGREDPERDTRQLWPREQHYRDTVLGTGPRLSSASHLGRLEANRSALGDLFCPHLDRFQKALG